MLADRELDLEEQIQTLSHKCKCRGFDGPCYHCMKMGPLERELDTLVAERTVCAQICGWIHTLPPDMTADQISTGIARQDWKKK